MNKERAKAIVGLTIRVNKLPSLADITQKFQDDIGMMFVNYSTEVQAVIDEADALSSEVEAIKEEEQEYYDNMPESLQGSERGEQASAAIDALDTAYEHLREIADISLEEPTVPDLPDVVDDVVASLDEAAGS